MKHLITGICLLLGNVQAQEQFRRILAVDPLMTNGYLVVDQAMKAILHIDRIEVDLLAHRIESAGGYRTEVVESHTITTGHYAKADLAALGLRPGDNASYHLRAYDRSNNLVLDIEDSRIGEGGGFLTQEMCSETCNSNVYAWTLRGYERSNGTAVIELENATINGSYYYFYVKAADMDAFCEQHPHSTFGLPSDWYAYTSPFPGASASTDVFWLAHMPGDAKNYLGYGVGSTGPGYAIRKDRGQWRDLHASAEIFHSDLSVLCASGATLRNAYNGSAGVLQQSGLYSLPQITCLAVPSTSADGQVWGESGPFNPCTQVTMWNGANSPEQALLDWALEVVNCHGSMDDGLGTISSVSINKWNGDSRTSVINVQIPDENDPKLIPVPRTSLEPGLYEFLIIRQDGGIVRHFEHCEERKTISASFTDFTHVNIYPVPVTQSSFSVDFDLVAPMAISMRVVNNMGVEYYTKALNFEVAGRNKHVVTMASDWPNGIYHAQFIYPDGSVDIVSITVE